MNYYDLQRHWRRIRPHLQDQVVADTLVRDLNKLLWGRWRKKFLPGMTPHQFESCDWHCGHRGRMPAFWQYTKHAACHWLVNFNLELAQASVPEHSWRIVTSDKHSTVWNGETLLFDFNFQAMKIPPKECFELAVTNGRELRPGQHRRTHTPAFWRDDP